MAIEAAKEEIRLQKEIEGLQRRIIRQPELFKAVGSDDALPHAVGFAQNDPEEPK